MNKIHHMMETNNGIYLLMESSVITEVEMETPDAYTT